MVDSQEYQQSEAAFDDDVNNVYRGSRTQGMNATDRSN